MTAAKSRVVALISGRGSNLQAIIDQTQDGSLPIELCSVISNKPQAQGLERAKTAGIDTSVIDRTQYGSQTEFEQALKNTIDDYKPALVVLAGFMRILSPDFVQHYDGRMLNIHPSLLPAYTGLDTHARALADKAKHHGASVHFVTAEVDGGPVIIQASVPILASDTVDELAARVLVQEHRIYPIAIRWFAEGRLRVCAGKVLLDNHIHPQQALRSSQ